MLLHRAGHQSIVQLTPENLTTHNNWNVHHIIMECTSAKLDGIGVKFSLTQ